MTRLQAASIGHSVDIVSTEIGVVHSVFARAANFEVCGNMWTLLPAPQADLPYGIRLPLTSLDALGMRSGDPAYIRAGFVGIGHRKPRLVVDCRTAPRWIAKSPRSLEPGLGGRLALASAAARARSWPGSAIMAHAVVHALQSGGSALDDVLVKVVGRGPGVTPSGDDVLIGILAVLTSPCSGTAGATAAGLATVMGHEISHALAHHGAERMAQTQIAQVLLGGAAGSLGDMDPQQRVEVLRVLNAGAQFGILKYSRKHETEADHMGLFLMAAAGYDPHETVKFWERMQSATKGGGRTPEFMSTHPSHETRIRDLLNLIPRAEPLYRASPDRDLPDEKLLWPPT